LNKNKTQIFFISIVMNKNIFYGLIFFCWGNTVEVGKAPESAAEKKAAALKLLPKAQRVVKVNVSWKNLTSTNPTADGAAAGDGSSSSSSSSFSLFHNNGTSSPACLSCFAPGQHP
jgi:hypothetical protein